MRTVWDADTHIAEPPEMWSFLDPEWYPRRPVVVSLPEDTQYGANDHMWLIDGQIFPKPAGRAGNILVTPTAQSSVRKHPGIKARELLDLPTRYADMQATQVDLQVVYPTLFLAYLTWDVAYEVALSKAYNRFLADVSDRSEGKIRWVVVPPLRDVDATIQELRFGKQHGACGVFFRGIEGDRTLDDPYFFPLYETASALDLPICIHTGGGCPAMTRIFDFGRNGSMPQSRMLPLIACRDLIANEIPSKFPRLRFGIIEAGAFWVPYVLHNLKRWFRTEGGWRSPSIFRDNRIFIACEADEDVPYLMQYVGEDNLLIGSDYGHNDPSEEPELVATMRAREDVPSSVIEKILCDNPARLYAL